MSLRLKTRDGATFDVPPTLACITTYILLEQEKWFEKELDFLVAWLRPGMTAIDIGANMGVYSVPIAKRVRRVYAYEPGSVARAYLERNRALNGVENLEIVPAAVSDAPRDGHLIAGKSIELNKLGDEGEPIVVTSLDHEDSIRDWNPDFIKIDAEYHEPMILAGGRRFFDRHSPLVMFEINGADQLKLDLVKAVEALGYETLRSLPGIPLLVPRAPGDPIDEYELNLFAAKPDRVGSLERDGFLVRPRDWLPDDDTLRHGADYLQSQHFSAAFPMLWAKPLDNEYLAALAGYAVWREKGNYAALNFAFRTMTALIAAIPNLAYQSTHARFAWEAGWQAASLNTLEHMRQTLGSGATSLEAPFWPASSHFDNARPSDAEAGNSFLASAFDRLVRGWRYSSRWDRVDVNLEWLASQPWVPTEILRRRIIRELHDGKPVTIPERLRRLAPDHLNAAAWASFAANGSFA